MQTKRKKYREKREKPAEKNNINYAKSNIILYKEFFCCCCCRCEDRYIRARAVSPHMGPSCAYTILPACVCLCAYGNVDDEIRLETDRRTAGSMTAAPLSKMAIIENMP